MKELLELLEQDAKYSTADLAVMLSKSEEEIIQAIKKLEENKTILKYNTIIDWAKAGVDSVTATIEVKVTPQREVGFDAIAERIYRFDEVRSVYLMSGSYDLLVVIEGNSLREVANFVSTRLSPIDGVISTTSHFMLKAYKKDGAILNDKENDHRLVVSP